MTTDFANAYAEIIKADKNDDGTLTVYGKATDDSIEHGSADLRSNMARSRYA
jgi:hypothetical protein